MRRRAPGKGASYTAAATADRHALYEQAVQSPEGDIAYIERVYRQYIGLGVPTHLREDFSGTAAISYTWCAKNVCRTAVGVDLDREALIWGRTRHAQEAARRVTLLHGNVLQPLASCTLVPEAATSSDTQVITNRGPHDQGPTSEWHAGSAAAGPAAAAEEGDEGQAQGVEQQAPDVVCAFNFSVFLLHKRCEVRQYLQQARAALAAGDNGGLLVMDVMGGGTVEKGGLVLARRNPVTGAEFWWEQARYNPVTRRLLAHIHLTDPHTNKPLLAAFTYDWRLWTLPDLLEMLREAGFSSVHVWIKPLKETSSTSQPVKAVGVRSSSGSRRGRTRPCPAGAPRRQWQQQWQQQWCQTQQVTRRGGGGPPDEQLDAELAQRSSPHQPKAGVTQSAEKELAAQLAPSQTDTTHRWDRVDVSEGEQAELQQEGSDPEDQGGQEQHVTSFEGEDEEGDDEYVEYNAKTASPELLRALCGGWTAYVVGVVQGQV